MVKPIEIYKKDKWNMLHVEIQGKQIIVREISDAWGEESHRFISRAEMMNWVDHRFSKEKFEGAEEEREQIIASFKKL